MADRKTIRKELRESLEIRLILLSNHPNIIHKNAIAKIEQLLKDNNYLNISTLQKALAMIRKIIKDNFKHGSF